MDGDEAKFLDQLEPRERLVLILRWADGFTVPEIACVLECSEAEAARLLERVEALAADATAPPVPVGACVSPSSLRSALRDLHR
ncbi:MAG: sigma factor-like helix-turn-helix DNA-binding protein [Phycisphaerales bacterium]